MDTGLYKILLLASSSIIVIIILSVYNNKSWYIFAEDF